MKSLFKNKTILITGASSGLGKEISRKLAVDAKNIILVARRKFEINLLSLELREKYPELNVYTEVCNLANHDEIVSFTKKLKKGIGHVDILVNSAGSGQTAYFEDADFDEIDELVKTNIIGLTHLCHEFLPGMINRGAGGILNFSSYFGLNILPGFSAYAGSKHYVSGFTEVLRAETSGTGVVISCAYPGPVKTAFWDTPNSEHYQPPSFLFIPVEQCVREILSGFRKGRSNIIPGLRIKLLVAFLSLSPALIIRMVNASVARTQRSKKVKQLAYSKNHVTNSK